MRAESREFAPPTHQCHLFRRQSGSTKIQIFHCLCLTGLPGASDLEKVLKPKGFCLTGTRSEIQTQDLRLRMGTFKGSKRFSDELARFFGFAFENWHTEQCACYDLGALKSLK